MKRIIAVLAVAIGLLACQSASAQTTYTQTNHVCQLYQCVGAQFDPAASLSYFLPEVFNALNRGQANVNFTNQYAYWCVGVGCTKIEYEDFNGTLVRTIHSSNPSCPVSTFCYELSGTFNAGLETADFKWVCIRSCGDNNSGSVVVSGAFIAKTMLCTDKGGVWWPVGKDGMCHIADKTKGVVLPYPQRVIAAQN